MKRLFLAASIAVLLPACRRSPELPARPARAAAVEATDRERLPSPAPDVPRVIWVGLDGADFDELDRLAGRGLLPNWSRLSGEGYRAKLKSFLPLLSPLVWTTEETGLSPEEHGVLDFQEEDPATGRLGPISERSRKAPSVWNVASNAGRKVGIAGFWATHPAEKVNGFFLSDRACPILEEGSAAGSVFPEDLAGALARAVRSDGTPPREDLESYLRVPAAEIESALAAEASPDNRIRWLSRILGSTRVLQRATRDFYDRLRPDFLAVYFEGTDEIGHFFAPFSPPKLPCVGPEEAERFGRAAETYFQAVDSILGQWMRRAREDRATLVVTSDHGFLWDQGRPCQRSSSGWSTAASWHRPDGVFAAWGERIAAKADAPPASVFDVAPTLSALLGIPVDARMKGSVIPVAKGLEARREKGLIGRTRVEFLPPAPVSERESSESVRKLVALGYLGSREAAGPAAAGRTARAWNNLGVYLKNSGSDSASAGRAFERSIEIDPSYHSPVFNLAEIEKERGNLPRAGRLLLKSVSLGQPEPEKAIERFAADFDRQRGGAGLNLYREARAQLPGNETIARDLALALSRRGSCREAAAVISPFEESRSTETLNVAGLAEECAGFDEKARKLLERSLEINPNQPEAAAALSRRRRP